MIARELNLSVDQVKSTAALLDDGATIPFIARYRKEATGSLDELAVTDIRDRLGQLRELENRRQAILTSLAENGHLTDALRDSVLAAPTLAQLEDVYLPYRPKRRTRATIAREKGLEALARAIFDQNGIHPEAAAGDFVDPDKGVDTTEDALAGARDIIAEWINEDAEARSTLRRFFLKRSTLKSRVARGKEKEGQKYRDYFDWEEPAAKAPSHRVLAIRRGEREDVLNMTVQPSKAEALDLLMPLFVRGNGLDSQHVATALQDSYHRLLSRSMETEIRLLIKDRADAAAIAIFATNLRELLLEPPLGPKRILAIDPGLRTGCKVACLDRQGKLLHSDTIYPQRASGQSARKMTTLLQEYRIEAIAVGNGTGGRETEAFLKTPADTANVPVIRVDESGASVYSASKVARDEFPDLDLTIRGAVSIGRRLMDPLSELVKIDPKSIGIGQYQHDVDQTDLKKALDDMVISCVNAVGVDVNRASAQLLTYVSGLGPALAKQIVIYRDTNGPFRNREEFKHVPRLGPKAFEQSAGFLRVMDGDNPLDASAVHPESYRVVAAMAADLDCPVSELMRNDALRSKINLQRYVNATVGMPTLRDILDELAKPGRDPRGAFESMEFASGIERMEDLEPGMTLPGVVTNVTAFGAFVDVGVHQDGLVHISQLSERFVKNPADVVRPRQQVTVTVLDVDLERKRIALSMKRDPHRDTGSRKKSRSTSRSKKKASPVRKPFHNPFADRFGKDGF